MKAVILAGGLGTRLSEETGSRPKPMVEIGGQPILWHIMKIYAAHGVKEFIICLGYKGYMIKEYFLNYRLHLSDMSINLRGGHVEFHAGEAEDWRVTLVETGPNTMTGGRLKRVQHYLGAEDFFMTYGDGLADVDIAAQLAFHRDQGRLATITGVIPPGRFGALDVEDQAVRSFREKPAGDGAQISGGFFVLSPRVIDLIDGDGTSWEREPLEYLAREKQLSAYMHAGFWQPMDVLRDKMYLEDLWVTGKAPWKIW